MPDIPPEIPEKGEIYRATLRGAPWTSLGWSPTSPGFVFWFQAQHFEGPRVVYGSDAVSKMGDDVCKAVRIDLKKTTVLPFELRHCTHSPCCGIFFHLYAGPYDFAQSKSYQ